MSQPDAGQVKWSTTRPVFIPTLGTVGWQKTNMGRGKPGSIFKFLFYSNQSFKAFWPYGQWWNIKEWKIQGKEGFAEGRPLKPAMGWFMPRCKMRLLKKKKDEAVTTGESQHLRTEIFSTLVWLQNDQQWDVYHLCLVQGHFQWGKISQ